MLLRADESMEHHLRKVVFLKLLITTLVDEIMEIEDKNSHFLVLQHIGLRITYLKYSEYSGLSWPVMLFHRLDSENESQKLLQDF